MNIQRETGSMFFNELASAGPVFCDVETSWPIASIEYAISKKPIAFTTEGKRISFPVRNIGNHEIVRIHRAARA